MQGQAVIGIRPEHVLIAPEDAGRARVYSSLPSGLETTIRLSPGSVMLTGVVSGGMDFDLDSRPGRLLLRPRTGAAV